jgi:hypothetical protein
LNNCHDEQNKTNHESGDEDEWQRETDDECDDANDEEWLTRFVLRPNQTSVQDQCSVSDKK